jgi:hypothetical protein
MHKALLPLLASLALCSTATAAVIVTTASAEPEKPKPMLVAQADQATQPRRMGRAMPDRAEMAAHLKQMCADGYARQVGAMAYLEARLDLTSAEKPLFARWKEAKLDITKRRTDACATRERPQNAERPSLIDRMAREQDMLKQRLADLDAERPALDAFYNALSQEQKAEFTRGVRELLMLREHRIFAGGRPGMMGHGMERGMMGHEMGGPAMMHHDGMGPPPGAPGDAPPGPPPQ